MAQRHTPVLLAVLALGLLAAGFGLLALTLASPTPGVAIAPPTPLPPVEPPPPLPVEPLATPMDPVVVEPEPEAPDEDDPYRSHLIRQSSDPGGPPTWGPRGPYNADAFYPQVEGPVHFVDSKHYRIEAEGRLEEAEEIARILEAAWYELFAFFGTAPIVPRDDLKLPVIYLQTRERWLARIAAERLSPPNLAAGLFDCASRAILLYRQETIHRTRETLLHEATHQFHLLGLPGARGAKAWWHKEGLAEHLERHLWDGERLQLGVVPMIGGGYWHRRASETLADHRFDLGRFIDGHPQLQPELQVLEIDGHRMDAEPYRYGEAYALVRYLLAGNGGYHREAMRRVLAVSDHRGNVGAAFREHLGDPREIRPQLAGFLKGERTVATSRQGDWELISPGRLEGTAVDGAPGGLTLRGASSYFWFGAGPSFHATVERPPPQREGRGGVGHWARGHRGNGPSSVLEVGEDLVLRLHRYEGSEIASTEELGPVLPSRPGLVQLRVEGSREGKKVHVEGELVHTFTGGGPVGPAVTRGSLRFRGVAP